MGHATDKLSVIGLALEDYLNDEKSQGNLDVRTIWYDIDSGVPETPAVLIEPNGLSRDLVETGHMTMNNFNITLTVLYSRMGSESATKRECLQLAEELEDILHANRYLNKLVYHSMVNSIELGLATRERTTLRAARLTWLGRSKTRL